MKATDPRYGGGSRPKIEQKDFPVGANAVVVTISHVEEEKVKGDKGDKILLVLITEEFGDKVHRLNVTQRDYLVEKLGDETDDWNGKRIPLVKTRQEYENKARGRVEQHDTVWVAAPEHWNTILNGDGAAPAKRGRGRK